MIAQRFTDGSLFVILTTQDSSSEYINPNATLAADWDLTEQIYHTMHDLPFSSIEQDWIRGHQDPLLEDLPIAAKYNIRADELAGKVVVPFHHSRYPQWILPYEKCRLSIQGIPLYGNYSFHIRRAATLPPYYEYLRKRHRWAQDTKATVDWPVLEAAANSTTIPPSQLMKLVHCKLPTRYEMSKSNRHILPTHPAV